MYRFSVYLEEQKIKKARKKNQRDTFPTPGLRTQQRIIDTAEDSVLRTEMANLEPQDEDAPKRVLSFKPMSWLGQQIRPHRRDES